ncbi:hypothetical protein [Altererythrobacter sp. ZODW24]|uniref:hypothetical protein n=1 Tax=Altererythrobacter sp. ZODW24 TaxID=2185142 RepID=UPI00196445DE|nr:hypothetical protein [Altererythrobacter sp. ZODW24]
MSNQIRIDALNIRKLVREAEALSDEAMIACARLKQAMLVARQNPEIPVDTGQRAILRLSEAERQAVAMSTNLLRVHDALSQVARERAGPDTDLPTDMNPSGIGMDIPVSEAA